MTLWTGASPSWWLARLGKAGGIGGTGLKNEELKSAGLIGTSATPLSPTTLQRLHSWHCFVQRQHCHMFENILQQKSQENCSFLTPKRKHRIVKGHECRSLKPFLEMPPCLSLLLPSKEGANTVKLLTPRLSSASPTLSFFQLLTSASTNSFFLSTPTSASTNSFSL